MPNDAYIRERARELGKSLIQKLYYQFGIMTTETTAASECLQDFTDSIAQALIAERQAAYLECAEIVREAEIVTHGGYYNTDDGRATLYEAAKLLRVKAIEASKEGGVRES